MPQGRELWDQPSWVLCMFWVNCLDEKRQLLKNEVSSFRRPFLRPVEL